MPNITQWYATGRRKEAVARVFLRPGTGRIVVNDKTMEEYFERKVAHYAIVQPLQCTEQTDSFDVYATVCGGGKTGQAHALRMAIARALSERSRKDRAPLKKAGLLTRDSRKVERKKYGRPGARKRFQFSKR